MLAAEIPAALANSLEVIAMVSVDMFHPFIIRSKGTGVVAVAIRSLNRN
jgi:hypothetical protein